MRDRITKSIHNASELIETIKRPFDPYDKNHIFNIMNEPTIKREKNKKYNDVNETYIQKNKKFNTSLVWTPNIGLFNCVWTYSCIEQD